MRLRSGLAVLAVVSTAALVATTARAQPDLPPPPPPPMGQPNDLPPPSQSSPPPRRAASGPPPYYYGPPRRRREVIYVVEEPVRRPFAVTLNPLGLFWGRLSANLEFLLAPHHSLVLSPNVLIMDATRPGLISDGFGFATRNSSGFGAELGYHYWWHRRRSLRGPFFGPSLLVGRTTQADPGVVGTTTSAQTYWGGAFDMGWQEVLSGGFTVGGGVGLGLARMADAQFVFPRLLFQIGWSF
jgi:hypothetical protein